MKSFKTLSEELAGLLTEHRNRASSDLDSLSAHEILRLINSEDRIVAIAVERELPYIKKAVDIVLEAIKAGGRLIYFGAGTSGRIGIVDAAECPPTFGTDPSLIRGVIAGGNAAMFQAQEGAEDKAENGARDVDDLSVGPTDVICGIAASRRTPYVVGAVRRARERKAKTIYLTTNPRAEFDLDVDVAICPEVGPEVLMGSTRMKSGTAQKLVLNMISTTVMVRLGKVYENMMIDLQLTNEKLVERSKRIIMMATGVDYDTAQDYLQKSGGHVKTAIVMLEGGVDKEAARRLILKADGFVRTAITMARSK